MGFLDDLRDRFTGGYDDDYDDDEYYDDEYDDEDYEDEDKGPTGSGILGNTPRPEAESVAVYTRSGRPVSTNAGGPASMSQRPPVTPRSSGSGYPSRRRGRDDMDLDEYDVRESSPSSSRVQPFNMSGQLPPYVLKAEEYEDVQTVVRRIRTNQPVYLVLTKTDPDIAQRILDFCFGLSFGVGGEVQPAADKAFIILPAGIQVSPSELDRLERETR